MPARSSGADRHGLHRLFVRRLILRHFFGESELGLRRATDAGTSDLTTVSPEQTGTTMNIELGPQQPSEAIDVVMLFAPRVPPRDQFEHSVAEWRSAGRAVLVVLPCSVDADGLQRLVAAGADLCVVAPTSAELFSHVERARCLHRRASHRDDEVLDTFWRTRSDRDRVRARAEPQP
jgi:hypothetical protein